MNRLGLVVPTIFFCFLCIIAGDGYAAGQNNLPDKIQELADKLTATTSGKVIAVDGDTIYINLGVKDSVHTGSRFEVVQLGDVVMVDNKPYYKEKSIAVIEVTRVRKEMSLARAIQAVEPVAKNNKVYQINSLSPSKLSTATLSGISTKQVVTVSGVDLRSVFRRLEKAGFSPGSYSDKQLTGLSAAIKRFQKLAHLPVTGSLDGATWKKVKQLYDPGEGDLVKTTATVNTTPAATMTIDQAVETGKNSKIALMEFNYGTTRNSLTRNIYESLSVALIQKGFQVVERTKLDQILKEQKLATTGLIDLSTAQKIGKLMGGSIVLLGSVSDMGNQIAIRARMVDVEKGVALTAAEVTLNKTPDIEAALGVNVTNSEVKGLRPHQDRSPSNAVQKYPVKEFEGFSFALQKCKKSGTTAKCDLVVTNKQNDRVLKVYARNSNDSIMFDNFGNAYKADNVHLANCSNIWSCTMRLIQGVPTRLSVSFADVASDTTMASVLNIAFRSENDATVEYRNIPFTK